MECRLLPVVRMLPADETKNTGAVPNAPSPARRRLLQGGLATGPVLMTIASRPVLGQSVCTASASVSVIPVNSLNHAHAHVCEEAAGLSPERWKAMAPDWPSPYVADLYANDGTCTDDDADHDRAERIRHVSDSPHRVVRESWTDDARRHDNDDGNTDNHCYAHDFDDVHVTDGSTRIYANDDNDDDERLRFLPYAARAALRESRPHGPGQQSARSHHDHLDDHGSDGTDRAADVYDGDHRKRTHDNADDDLVFVYVPVAWNQFAVHPGQHVDRIRPDDHDDLDPDRDLRSARRSGRHQWDRVPLPNHRPQRADVRQPDDARRPERRRRRLRRARPIYGGCAPECEVRPGARAARVHGSQHVERLRDARLLRAGRWRTLGRRGNRRVHAEDDRVARRRRPGAARHLRRRRRSVTP